MDNFSRLVDIVAQLRAPGGCAWDQAQTFQSLRPHIIEEAYELADTMESNDMAHMREELGDVLLHVVMLSTMAAETDVFTVADVIDDVCEKMIRRHPHVFGSAKAETADDVVETWEAVKAKEQIDAKETIFSGIPKALPALMKAEKVQRRAAKTGFDWPDVVGALEKVSEELDELSAAIKSGNAASIDDELGDVFFSMVNVARKLGKDPEDILQNGVAKFMDRYLKMQALAEKEGLSFNDLSLAQKESFWQAAKG